MNKHHDNIQKKDKGAIANHQIQKKDKNSTTAQFVDNRPEAVAQRQLQEVANGGAEDSVASKENKTGLPDNLKSGIENLSGYSMDDVKVHYNSSKPADINAHAYAQGTDIHLASGQEKHLGHEAWHVVQQKEGRVEPTLQMKGEMNINDDAGLEKEADVMGAMALQKEVDNPTKEEKKNSNSSGTIQRHIIKKDGANIWATEIASRLTQESDDEIIDAIHRLHSIDAWIKVDSYDELVTNIKEGAYQEEIDKSLKESPDKAKYDKSGPKTNIYSRGDLEEMGISEQGRLSAQDRIYKSDGASDPFYINRIKQDEKGRNTLKLGWGSAAHVIEVNGSYFLKKMFVGSSTYNPDKTDITETWKGTYHNTDSGLEITFDVSAEGGEVELSEIITFGVSTCSFSVVADAGLKNIILMHINNGDEMPFNEMYAQSPEFRESMTQMYVSMIDEEEEVDKIMTATRKAGIQDLNILSRPYDITDADRIHKETHHSIGLNLENEPTVIGEQGDAVSVFKAVVNKICKKVHDQIEAKTSFFGNLAESDAQIIYDELHAELQNLDMESLELSMQLIDWLGRLKSKGNIKESNERRAIMGAKALYENPSSSEGDKIKQFIQEQVDRRINFQLPKK